MQALCSRRRTEPCCRMPRGARRRRPCGQQFFARRAPRRKVRAIKALRGGARTRAPEALPLVSLPPLRLRPLARALVAPPLRGRRLQASGAALPRAAARAHREVRSCRPRAAAARRGRLGLRGLGPTLPQPRDAGRLPLPWRRRQPPRPARRAIMRARRWRALPPRGSRARRRARAGHARHRQASSARRRARAGCHATHLAARAARTLAAAPGASATQGRRTVRDASPLFATGLSEGRRAHRVCRRDAMTSHSRWRAVAAGVLTAVPTSAALSHSLQLF